MENPYGMAGGSFGWEYWRLDPEIDGELGQQPAAPLEDSDVAALTLFEDVRRFRDDPDAFNFES